MSQVCGRNRSKIVIKNDSVSTLIVSAAEKQRPKNHKIKCKITTMIISGKNLK